MLEHEAQRQDLNSSSVGWREESYKLHKRGLGRELAPQENRLRRLAVHGVFTNGGKRTEKAQEEDSANCWPSATNLLLGGVALP